MHAGWDSGIPERAWATLATSLSGVVVRAGDAGYQPACAWPVDTGDDLLPQAVAMCSGRDDVRKVVRFAGRHDQPIAVRGGGHSFAGHSRTAGILVDTTPMREIRLDGDTATVGAGVRLGELYDGLHRGRRTLPAGCGPTVGVAGLALGGGLGVLGRAHGLTCDALVGAEVVLADGSIVSCDRRRDPDLFWALRGAGSGNFGVVTSLTFQTLSDPGATAFHLAAPADSAPAVMAAWQHWLRSAPDTVSPSLQVKAPAAPDRPARLHLLGAAVGPASTGSELEDLFGTWPGSATPQDLLSGSVRDVKSHLASVGQQVEAESSSSTGSRSRARSEFIDVPLTEQAIGALVAAVTADREAGQARELDITALGGAYNRVPADETAFVHRRDLFLLKYAVTADRPDHQADGAGAWLDSVSRIVAPHGTGRAYQNFADPSLASPLRAYYGQNLERLVRVKDHYDPSDTFHHAQSITTSTSAAGEPRGAPTPG